MDYAKMNATKGGAYRNCKPLPNPKVPKEDQKGKYSYYLLPIAKSTSGSNGNGRIWGDASADVQKKVIDTVISTSKQYGLNTRETAYVLAMAYVESGFNPDAAAGTTSASGVGQFVIDTGEEYDLTYTMFDKNPTHFDISCNVDALVRYYKFNRKWAEKKGFTGRRQEEMIYVYHHDGLAGTDHGGLKISKDRIMPLVDNIEKVLNGTFTGEHVDPGRVAKKRQSHVQMALSVPKPRTNKKYIDPAAANRLHPNAAETSAWYQKDYYNTKHWNIASRLYHLFHHDYDPDDGWTD